jgi:RNA polymerase sigma-70 factor, ECF subfamily
LEEDQQLHLPAQQGADQTLRAKEIGSRIDNAIARLPTACRTIFILSRFEQLSNKQIAEALQLSVKTVENQMTKALRLLKNALGVFFIFLYLKNIF